MPDSPTPSPLPHEYLTIREAAAALKVTPTTVTRMIRRGDLPAWKSGHVIRIDAQQVDELFRNNSTTKS